MAIGMRVTQSSTTMLQRVLGEWWYRRKKWKYLKLETEGVRNEEKNQRKSTQNRHTMNPHMHVAAKAARDLKKWNNTWKVEVKPNVEGNPNVYKKKSTLHTQQRSEDGETPMQPRSRHHTLIAKLCVLQRQLEASTTYGNQCSCHHQLDSYTPIILRRNRTSYPLASQATHHPSPPSNPSWRGTVLHVTFIMLITVTYKEKQSKTAQSV